MYADLNPEDWHWLDVIVKNFGQTSAYGVRLHFDPWPTAMPWRHPLTSERVSRLLTPSEIPVLAPGQERRTAWEDGPERVRAEADREAFREIPVHPSVIEALPDDLGLRFEGWVEFEDSEHRRYRNPAVLDLHMFFDMRRRKKVETPTSD